MTVVAAPAMRIPSGIVRRGFLISCPTNAVSSKPEKAKHIADQSPSVSSIAPRGTMFWPVNGVADPKRASAIAAHPISSPAGIQTPKVPKFWSHFPVRRPMMLSPAAIQMPASTNATAYQRLAASPCQRSPPIAAKFAAPKSSTDGK
jgi:hypothetical protein